MKTKKLIEIAHKHGYKTFLGDGIKFYPEVSRADTADHGEGFMMVKGVRYSVSYEMPPELAHAIIDYANTPVKERETKWNVIIASELFGFMVRYTIWYRAGGSQKYLTDDCVSETSLQSRYAIFTDSEFDDLITYIKSLPDGDKYAKIAELGKCEVKS